MTRILKVLLPILLIVAGVALAGAMIASRPEPETRRPQVVVPLVRVQQIELRDYSLVVESQGTVTPRTESSLAAEVSGSIIEVSRSFESGGFFRRGDLLVRIDPLDYRQVVIQAQSRVAQSELRLAEQEAETEIALKEWNDLGSDSPTSLALREPQLNQARAALAAAHAELERAERNLKRTEVRAPYTGRIRTKLVDLGQFVNRGTPVAAIYATDEVEVTLPLPDDDLAFVDLPMAYRGEAPPGGPAVTLRAEFAGGTHEWQGRIVRTEGEIDPRSRMVQAIARVKNPYAGGEDGRRPPLAPGLFVQAEITGHTVSEVALIPRSALRRNDRVLVVDAEERLRFRDVVVLRTTDNEAVIRSGLAEGERICLSNLAVVTDGMRIQVISDGGDGS